MHIKESSLRRVGPGGGLGSLGPLTRTAKEGPHSREGSITRGLTHKRAQSHGSEGHRGIRGLIHMTLEGLLEGHC